MEDDDFTFPTVAAAPAAAPLPAQPEGQLGSPPVPRLLHHELPVPDLAAASPLWPFAGSPKAAAPPPPCTPVATKDDEEVGPPVPASTAGRAEAEAEEEEARRAAAAADEERMDLLWDVNASPSPATRSAGSTAGGHAEPPPAPKQERRGEDDDNDKRRAAAVADAERMDKLWESFNEDLLLLRRHARSKSAAAAGHPGEGKDTWYLCSSYPASDAESSEETAASSSASPAEERRRGYGCAPTMLRASSRAGGGAAQFCGGSSSPSRRRGGGRRGGWALLLRLFRRLFSVDKATTATASRSHATSIYVP